jgi:hypothetical protein
MTVMILIINLFDVNWSGRFRRIVMRRVLALFAILVAPVAGQYNSLIAPGNGADLYFSIDLPLKGSSDQRQGRIFKVGSTPLTKVTEVTNIPPVNLCGSFTCLSTYYWLTQPDFSRDGTG